MKKIALMGMTLAVLAEVACALPVVYRNPSDGRAWEVAPDASEPLVWQWAEGAVSATVTVSNVLSGATAATTVARGGGEAAGGGREVREACAERVAGRERTS